MVLYRYDSHGTSIILGKYIVKKHTPCGYWIDYGKKKKWIANSGYKRFAYPTKEEALNALSKRKARQIVILVGQLEDSKVVLETIRKVSIKDIGDMYIEGQEEWEDIIK